VAGFEEGVILMLLRNACLLSVVVLFGCDGVDVEPTGLDANAEIVANLKVAGYPESEIAVVGDQVIAGGDAVVSLEASREMIGLADGHEHEDGTQFRQYRTSNLVDPSVAVICVDGSAWTGTLSQALDASIANYTNLGLSFDMKRTSGSTAGCDAVIKATSKGGAGGSSGFPEGGLPYDTINVGKSTTSYGLAVTTHVVTHELGHCVGFRHTDYYNRTISCGTGGNEGDGGVGAIHIQGTPTTAVIDGSVMNSCFNGGSTGKWTASDVTALNAVY
jgi:hypothetical protein